MSIFNQYRDLRDYFKVSPLSLIIIIVNTFMLLLTYVMNANLGYNMLDGIRGITLFELGAVEVTSAAAAALKVNSLTADDLLSRHQRGDWGDVDAFHWQKNDVRLQRGAQLNSRYVLKDGTEILIATAGDRTSTRVYLDADHVFQEVDTRTGYTVWASTYNRGRNPLIESDSQPRGKSPALTRIHGGIGPLTTIPQHDPPMPPRLPIR